MQNSNKFHLLVWNLFHRTDGLICNSCLNKTLVSNSLYIRILFWKKFKFKMIALGLEFTLNRWKLDVILLTTHTSGMCLHEKASQSNQLFDNCLVSSWYYYVNYRRITFFSKTEKTLNHVVLALKHVDILSNFILVWFISLFWFNIQKKQNNFRSIFWAV